MTPPRNATKNSNGPRLYPWPPPPAEHDLWVPSATSVLGVINKPAIAGWKVKQCAEAAIRLHKTGALAALIAQDEKMAEAAIKSAWKTDLDAAGDAGTLIHARLEAQIKNEPLPEMTEEAEQVFANVQKILDDYSVEVLYSECTVYGTHRNLEWGGTLDMIVEMDIPGQGRGLYVADLKTGKGVYLESCLQVGGAYANADKLVTGDNGEIIDMPEVDGAVIFHVRQDKSLVIPVAADDTAYKAFMAARTFWGIQNDKSWTSVFAPLPKTITGDK